MLSTLGPAWAPIFAIWGIALGWWGAVIWHDRQLKVMRAKTAPYEIINGIEPAEWSMSRPVEFGPVSLPRTTVDRIRDAIVEDQLGTRRESPKQRRQRMTRLAGFTDRQRVQHWLLHWREDYMAGLTGRSWAAI